VLAPHRLRDPQFVERVRQIAPDCCPVVAYGGLLTSELLEIPRFGWINLHFSLLPAYRGASPVQRALLDGCTHTGLTVFRIVPALDAGPIFVQRRVEVMADETAGDLLERLSLLGAQAMADGLFMAQRGDQPTEQPDLGVSLAPKILPEEAQLDMSDSGRKIMDRVRAMSPEPGAWARMGEGRLKVLRASFIPDDQTDFDRGHLVATKRDLLCRVEDGWLALIEVHPPGKRPMSGADWARGANLAGVRLE